MDRNLQALNILYLDGYRDGFQNSYKGMGGPLSTIPEYMDGYQDGRADYKTFSEEYSGVPGESTVKSYLYKIARMRYVAGS